MTALQYSNYEIKEDVQDASTYNEVSENDFPAQRRRLLEALSYLEKLEDNWNGHTALKPTAQSISMAKHFVIYLFLNKQHADFIEPDGDGGIILKWQSGGKRIFITIDGFELHMSYQENGEEPIFIDNVKFFDTSNKILPTKIVEYIPNYSANA